MKNKIKKPTRKNLDCFFKDLEKAEELFYADISRIEKQMREYYAIKDIEFFFNDGCVVGIGNASRTMKLIHR